MKFSDSFLSLALIFAPATAAPVDSADISSTALIPRFEGHSSTVVARGGTGPTMETGKADDYVPNWWGVYDAIWEFASDMGSNGRHFANPGGLNGIGNPVAWTRTHGGVTAYACDYGHGIDLNALDYMRDMLQLLDPSFQGNSGRENYIRPAYFNHPEWKSSWGFTIEGRSFC
jgi:hypothetical protein